MKNSEAALSSFLTTDQLITNLRDEIRQDMKDYKLLTTDKHIGTEISTSFLFGEGDRSCLM